VIVDPADSTKRVALPQRTPEKLKQEATEETEKKATTTGCGKLAMGTKDFEQKEAKDAKRGRKKVSNRRDGSFANLLFASLAAFCLNCRRSPIEP
jgi:hypothetical protein